MQEVTLFISHHPWLCVAIAILLVILMGMEVWRLRRNHVRLSPVRVIHLINKENAVVIDIRSNEAFRQGHIINAQLLSVADIKNNPKKLEKYKSRPIIIVCSNGVESQKITAALFKQGYNSYSLGGGLRAWSDANMPIIKD